jgi:hypothetical protein
MCIITRIILISTTIISTITTITIHTTEPWVVVVVLVTKWDVPDTNLLLQIRILSSRAV